MKFIPYGKQSITKEDIDAVVKVLRSESLTQGPEIKMFEEEFAYYIGSKFAIAVANGTAALHLSILALDLHPGDKIITTPITFAASANCVRFAGGEVVFVDIDPNTYLIDIKKVRELLEASPNGTYKGIISVDFAGRSVDLEELKKLAEKYNCWILEDACHAPGGYFIDAKGKKQRCGNGVFTELAVFSFHPVKHITTGEGGMITTNNEKLYKNLQLLRTHGITKDKNTFLNTTKLANGQQVTFNDQWPGWYYEMQGLGYNYRVTDFQAALGLSQLKRADFYLERRKKIAELYNKAFANKPFIIGQSGIVEGHSYHLYIIEVEDRKGLYDHLRLNNILAQVHYIPLHLMPYYKQLGCSRFKLPNAENYYSRCLSLPMYPTLKKAEQEFVIKTIYQFYNH